MLFRSNLNNSCDVSVAFHTFRDVPVVITILASFLLGLLMAFPLSFVRKPGKHVTRIKHGTKTERGMEAVEQGPSFGSTLPTSRRNQRKAVIPDDSFDQD